MTLSVWQWVAVLGGGVIGLWGLYLMQALHGRFRRRPGTLIPPDSEPMELGLEPMDPRGDGVLRPGDPMFELLLKGNEVSAVRDEHNPTVWHVSMSVPDEKVVEALAEIFDDEDD